MVSVLFNEPKLLKFTFDRDAHSFALSFSALQRAEIAEIETAARRQRARLRFSALQRAEIAEILPSRRRASRLCRFSALQRAEIAEIKSRKLGIDKRRGFSALQRAEIAEILMSYSTVPTVPTHVSVLFNEPKLLKFWRENLIPALLDVSVLFNEPKLLKWLW